MNTDCLLAIIEIILKHNKIICLYCWTDFFLSFILFEHCKKGEKKKFNFALKSSA